MLRDFRSRPAPLMSTIELDLVSKRWDDTVAVNQVSFEVAEGSLAVQQRTAQVDHLRALHREACGHQADRGQPQHRGSPFEARLRPPSALLCGDFNFLTDSAEYARMLEPIDDAPAWRDAWCLAHPGEPHAHTNGVHDRVQWPKPHTCDFVFVTEDLAPAVSALHVDAKSDASDHQPVLIELDGAARIRP